MSVANEMVIKTEGFTLHIVKTNKYKTNTLVWKMKAPLNAETVTLRALLLNVLQSSTKKYPTTTALRTYLDDLYGAGFFVDLAKKGEQHIMSFSIDIANEKFLKDSTPLLQKGIDFLAEVLLNPNIENESFHQETVEKEKRILKQRIQSIYDDKMRYSNVRLVEEMCKGEPYALDANGIASKVEEITPQNLFDYYKKAISEDELHLYIIGDVNENEVETFCRNLQFENRTPIQLERKEGSNVKEVKEIKEKQDVKQGKLNIGYRTNVRFGDQDYFALQVFNGIFGGFSHSKLFINVREKASLAYYAASRLESHKGLLMVMSGIEAKNYDQATTIIREQMDAMKKGDFTDQEIEQTKAVINNQLLETTDTSRGLVEILYHNVIANQNFTVDDWIQGINKISKQDIIEVAKKIELDTIYFLTGLEGNGE
ncbi:EF-P 5-aminopentanol modification-associated protein YfmF [Heyndrickxia oleronia]|jgi:predicted Zn-dependent peptidase|uniref:EF-P 5-aminopentanol modification-associated protein YfmF n=1 Tax=Heyndrickxia oleronia TaxID=38875 RepID=UPI00242DAD11|nr:pitrilysin family protein [Heyndrickxia oleronia]MCI1592013.1 insulinase family protein [Heyndrickxia oleronia]MCI1614585.1 insulinase family protein [Heyndrickxia oleronia]MCI1762410.1 insulinase family protein [Heyndrickxia oleronia]